ncbi:mucin-7 [Osmerus eperlanus]|uniref:mucin-7 n=1 Tax=Osmerus eperlanus TaxID=29151 RepID=UPI002E0D6B2C
MKFEIKLVFCALVVLTSSSQTKGHSSAPLHILTPSSTPGEGVSVTFPVPSLDSVNLSSVPEPESSPANEPSADQNGDTPEPDVTVGNSLLQSESIPDVGDSGDVVTTPGMTTPQPNPAYTLLPAAPSEENEHVSGTSLSPPTLMSSSPAELTSTPGGVTYLAGDQLTSSTPHTLNASPTSHAVTPAQPSSPPSTLGLTPAPTQPPMTASPQTSAQPHAPVGPSHQEVPSELNVGDEDAKLSHHPSSPLDPLLAGLVSIFIVTTAIISVVLFLRFRQRTNHPEFHRLQDLPMDDLMEDTPLSRYTY